jgi:hypothetical protein
MTKADLARLEALYRRTTGGKWIYGRGYGQCTDQHQHGVGNCRYRYRIDAGGGLVVLTGSGDFSQPITLGVADSEECYGIGEHNCAWIAASHEAWPEIREVLAELEELREWAANVDARNRTLFPVYNEKPEES